jgi:hypothetical protein
MLQEVAQEWVKALRSGNYKQTHGYLNILESNERDVPVGFCCLGVLCEIAVNDGLVDNLDIYDVNADSRRRFDARTYDGASALLPGKVGQAYGIHDGDGGSLTIAEVREFISPDVLREIGGGQGEEFDNIKVTLVDLNDSGATFEQIANVIERYWEKL